MKKYIRRELDKIYLINDGSKIKVDVNIDITSIDLDSHSWSFNYSIKTDEVLVKGSKKKIGLDHWEMYHFREFVQKEEVRLAEEFIDSL
jgi:hypothetical protein